MAGTKIGGLKAAAMNKLKYGDDFYKGIGLKGGRAEHSKPRGFAANPELAKYAGAKGGRISKIDMGVKAKINNAKHDIIDRYYNKLESSESIGRVYGVAGSTIRYYINRWKKDEKTQQEEYELYVEECRDSGSLGHILSYGDWLKARKVKNETTKTD